jgi:hypothetical protein
VSVEYLVSLRTHLFQIVDKDCPLLRHVSLGYFRNKPTW